MKYYSRTITKRTGGGCRKNHYRGWYESFQEVVFTDDITPFNFRKRIKFEELPIEKVKQELTPNKVYEFRKEW